MDIVSVKNSQKNVDNACSLLHIAAVAYLSLSLFLSLYRIQ